METQVLIVGAGPVGLTLAIDLGRRGVRCMLIEQKQAPQFLPKMERCNARTMEIYRRLGLAQKIRAAGLPARTPDGRLHRHLAGRAAAPAPALSVGRARRRRRSPPPTTGRQPLEPYQLISQYTLEPLLKAEAETLPSVTVRYGCEFLSFSAGCAVGERARSATRGGATSRSAPPTWSAATAARARCASSSASGSSGEGNLLELRQALYRCDDLYERIPIGKGRHYHVADGQATFLIVQDDTRHFTLHSVVENGRRHGGDVRDGPSPCRSTTRCSMSAAGSRTCCSPTATRRAACSSPAMRCTSSSRPAGSA